MYLPVSSPGSMLQGPLTLVVGPHGEALRPAVKAPAAHPSECGKEAGEEGAAKGGDRRRPRPCCVERPGDLGGGEHIVHGQFGCHRGN